MPVAGTGCLFDVEKQVQCTGLRAIIKRKYKAKGKAAPGCIRKKGRKDMEYSEQIDLLEIEMMRFNGGDPKRIQHLMKVHRYAQLIGHMEKLDEHTQFVTECAALVHDIGIRPAEEKYGACNGKLQEQEGPAYARKMLKELHFDERDIERICYLVAHHHTYTDIKGVDYQILVEADFLVNFYEDDASRDAIQSVYDKIFRTQAGKTMCEISYLAE